MKFKIVISVRCLKVVPREEMLILQNVVQEVQKQVQEGFAKTYNGLGNLLGGMTNK